MSASTRSVQATPAFPVKASVLSTVPNQLLSGPLPLITDAGGGGEIALSRIGDPMAVPRISRDGRLLDATATYVIGAAEEAEACDFLVVDGVLSAEDCKALARAFRGLARRVLNGSTPAGNRFLWLHEIAAADVGARCIVAAAMEQAIALAKDFYEIEGPISAASSRIVEVQEGKFAYSPSRIVGTLNGGGKPEFAAAIYLNEDFEGGDSYFSALDIAVRPKRGRLVAAPADTQHRHAVLRVDSGVRLILEFQMTAEPNDKPAGLALSASASDLHR
jgi:hypothetical protein